MVSWAGTAAAGHQELPSSRVWGLLLCWGLAAGLGPVLWITSVYRMCIAMFPFSFPPHWSKPPFLCFPACFSPSIGLKAQLGCASLPRVRAQGQGCLQASVRAGSGPRSELAGMRYLWKNERAGAIGIFPWLGWVWGGLPPPPRSL